MTNEIDATKAVLNVLRTINPPVEKPLVFFELGIPLIVEQRFTQDEVMNAILYLNSQGVIDILEGNRFCLLKPFSELK